VLRTVEWDSSLTLNLHTILITLAWLPITTMLCQLYSDVLLQKLTIGILKFFDYVFLTVAYIPLQDDLPSMRVGTLIVATLL